MAYMLLCFPISTLFFDVLQYFFANKPPNCNQTKPNLPYQYSKSKTKLGKFGKFLGFDEDYP